MKQAMLNSFRNISWHKVQGVPPAITEAACSLRQRVAGAPDGPVVLAAASALSPEMLAAIDVRVGPLQQRLAALDLESRASFDVVRSIFEHHTQIVGAVDLLLARTRLLLGLALALGAAVLSLAVLLAVRW